MTIEELTKAYIEKLAELQAEETLDGEIRRVIRVAQRRQQIYKDALPAAEGGRTIELLDTASLVVKVVAVTAVGVAVGAYLAGPAVVAFLEQSSATAWTTTKLGISVTFGSKTVGIISTSVGAAGLSALATPYLSGKRWPTIWGNGLTPPNFALVGGREQHADDGSSILGLLFRYYYYSKFTDKLDVIEQTFTKMGAGCWPGWENVKIIPSIIQDEGEFTNTLDTSVYRQLLQSGASSGKAYLEKVKTCYAFWAELEKHLIQHRIQHNYQGNMPGQGTIAVLKGEAAALASQLNQAIAAQGK